MVLWLNPHIVRTLHVKRCPQLVAARRFSSNVRNLAIIAHVDHGKTTLVDCLLRQSGTIAESADSSRVMDSNELEKERGITILAKCTSIEKDGYRINIVDTPGHADFGGEVERALTMVDGVILVVDATEGPMAQTKFVLSKALQKQLIPIVVQNKVDRDTARCDEVDCEILDLFMSLHCSDSQLDYPTIYASAREGWAQSKAPTTLDIKDRRNAKDMSCLFDLIMSRIPPPKVESNKPFAMLVNNVERNAFVGKCMMGKVSSGNVKIGDRIRALNPDGNIVEESRVTRMFIRHGLKQIDIQEGRAGDILSLAGVSGATVNHTIASVEVTTPLPVIPVDPPTVSMTFMVNTSPISGQEGKSLTRLSLKERLSLECENNVSLKLENSDNPDQFKLSGRGELQLGVIIETIRREGYELAVSPPQVLYKTSESGHKMEPIEEITIDVDSEFSGIVIEKISKRKAEILRMNDGVDGKFRIVAKCPTRGLIGYGSELKNDTKGTGVLNHTFAGHEEYKGPIEFSRKGSLISMATGPCTSYSLADLESRGTLFVGPGTVVYPGMVIGECSRDQDLEVNPCRSKAVSNVRSTLKEEFFRLAPPRQFALEEYIAYMADDEILEVTPKNIRLRKAELDSAARKKRTYSR